MNNVQQFYNNFLLFPVTKFQCWNNFGSLFCYLAGIALSCYDGCRAVHEPPLRKKLMKDFSYDYR